MKKTDLEKMLAGELYNGSAPELIEMRHRANRLVTDFDKLSSSQVTERNAILKKLLGKLGEDSEIMPPFFCDYGCHIFIGKKNYINYNCTILDCAHVRIGDNVMFGPNVQLYTAYHPIQAAERIKGPELAAPITIGDNVWLGGGVIVCQGVTVGANTTIGAGSVITKNIPSNVFAAGNPCKIIRLL